VNDDTADLDRLFARLSGEGHAPDPDDHPAPEKLSAYLANELSPEEDGVIQEHLAHCTLCTELVLDLQRFLDPPAEDLPRDGVVDFETEAAWRELRGRGDRRAMGVSDSQRSRGTGSLRNAYSLAAVLALTVVGLGVYVIKLHSDLKAPRAGYHIALTSTLRTRGSLESVEKELRLHEAPEDFSLTLDKDPDLDFPSYLVEILREKGPRVQSAKGLRYQKGEGITLLLSKDDFEPGIYEIVLRGLRDGRSEVAGKYWLSVLP
jgi:hypothetical protein